MKQNMNNLKNKTKNIPKIYYIVNTFNLQRCIGMRKKILSVFYKFFLFVENKAIVIQLVVNGRVMVPKSKGQIQFIWNHCLGC